ncbi:hypothetical protein [Lactococcus phage i0139]|uniref:Uncharacterized protein n=3 Tax=Skunavirus i0139 TaxID=2845473 RepID=A0A126HAF7_9CAUD|nr:hypothetical protein HYP02_gp45 [Lactococcus phage i0139]ALM63392.1 hypothetical protein PhiD18_46 [Lactococcus phage 936 group phage PhiD.18]ALM63552.1 hypothetical protein Phi43_47 [Lactococcus phage 936 group phage Phi43]ALM63606.1 hypothetical protein Phi129_47 [Lactococcus phage 936 group phage Phi129]ANY28949.1 hypothetical protein [Lactococcus phage i0139]
MSYTTKHKPYKLKSIKCNGCGWSISHCIELEKSQMKPKALFADSVSRFSFEI